jgi:hypothetical protein
MQTERRKNWVLIRAADVYLLRNFQKTLGFIQRCIQYLSGDLTVELKHPDPEAHAQSSQLSNLIIRGFISPLPHTPYGMVLEE